VGENANMKHAIISIVLCAAIIGAGYVATRIVAAKARGTSSQAEAAVPEQDIANVTTVNVHVLKPVLVNDQLVLTGHVQPWQEILISAEGAGKIEWQGVKEGDRVQKGQELLKIDTRVMRAQLDQAEAQHKLACQELQRAKTLSTKGVTSGQSLDKCQADCDMAAANVRLMTIRLEKSVVAAPTDGVIDKLLKEQDEFVDVGIPLLRLVQVQKVKVGAGIPERDVSAFAKNDAVTVQLDALPGRIFQGKIYRVAPTAEPTTLTFISEIEVDNPDGLIKPGMIARSALVRKSYPDAIAVPIFSILSMENQRYVMLEKDGIARMRPIEAGVLQGNSVQVVKGLESGDRLIVAGQRDIQDGDPVKVVEVVP